MKPLSPGTTVFITDIKCRGKVIQRASTPRSCIVDTSTAVVRRNRLHLRIIADNPVNHDKEQPMLIERTKDTIDGIGVI